MRKLKLQMQMTVDGFVAGPQGEMDWMVFDWDNSLKSYVAGIMQSVDCIVMGRKLAQGFIPHWAARPESEPDEAIDFMNNTPRVVFSRTLAECPWANTTLPKGDMAAEIRRLKAQPGGDIITYGGAGFAASLVKHNLVDEYHLFINPIAIGSGLRIFGELDGNLALRADEPRLFPNGIVVMRYRNALD